MSLINGTIDRRGDVLTASNLRENPFVRTEPPEAVIDQVFVGRVDQLRDAALRLVDRPRNLLVMGGYGMGKTTFIRKLLRELHTSKKKRFLTGYSPLRHDSPQGFQLAALSALAEAAVMAEPPEKTPLGEWALQTRADLARLDPAAPDRLRAPDIAFRQGLQLAHASYSRVVIAIDEIDKRDAQVVQTILMGSRYFLDLEASFVLTGLFMDVFSDIRASLLAAFDHRIELRPFTPEECEEIVRRNLEVARLKAEPQPSLSPFQQDVVREMTRRAQGLPRPLNLMAEAALEEAVREAMRNPAQPLTVTLTHLDEALKREGNLVFNDVGSQARDLLARIFKRNGYVSGAELDALSPASLPETVRLLEDLARRDAVLRLGATEGPAFALSPTVSRTLADIQKERERLQALWSDAKEAPDTRTRGLALEEFAAMFFGHAFKVVERNARTDTEELDLVLERSAATPPRFSDIYFVVECKNWRAQPVDQAVVTQLAGKMALHHRTQGFLLTAGEFTADAKRQAAHAFSAQKLEIILIDGKTIETFLGGLETVEDFLVERHKSQVVLRSY